MKNNCKWSKSNCK